MIIVHRIAAVVVPFTFAAMSCCFTDKTHYILLSFGVSAIIMQTIGLWETRPPQRFAWYYDTDWEVVLVTAWRAVELVWMGAWWYHSNKVTCRLDASRMLFFRFLAALLMIWLGFKNEPSTDVRGRPFGIAEIAFILKGLLLVFPSIVMVPSALLASVIGRRVFPSRARTIDQVLSCLSCLFFRVGSFYFQAQFVLACFGLGNGLNLAVCSYTLYYSTCGSYASIASSTKPTGDRSLTIKYILASFFFPLFIPDESGDRLLPLVMQCF